jgi:spermidine synthase
MSRTRAASPALHILFFFSGAAALGYQLVWSKMFSTGLGHEMPAVLAIICAFMAGMALGAAVFDRFIPRSSRAGLWLCGLELTIGAWAILASFAIPRVNELVLQLIGLDPVALKHWTVAFAIPALTLLPATMAMGATLPAMEKFLSVSAPQNESVGSVYAANTFGAVAGTLLAPYVLMPALGLGKSCWVLAGMNALVAMSAFLLSRGPSNAAAPSTISQHGLLPSRLRLTLFLTGLLGIGYETAGVRVLSQVLKNTVFTYAAVLSVFLVGTAAGAAAYHRWWRKREPRQLLATLLCGTALACFVGMLLMTRAPSFYLFARKLGDSRMTVLIAELLTATLAFALPTFCMGATFSHLAQMARATRGSIGTAVALNTIGAALAPAICGVVLIPLIGTKWTLLLVGVGYALLLPMKPNMKLTFVCVGACASVLFTNLRIISVPPGGQVIDFREGVMASVSVVAEGTNRTLRVDNSFQMGGTAAADVEYRQAHIPLLLHPAPRRALFLGVGTGISFGAASLYPQLKADGVELVPEVVEVMGAFESKNFSPQQQPNLKLHVVDARRFVRSSAERYDVIVGDLFHPYRDGAGALYTREHFAAVRARLATNGLFCQWLPLHQLDEPTLRVVIWTFLEEFPNADAWLLRFNVEAPVLGLIGWNGGRRFSTNWIESRLAEPRLATEIKRLALADSVRVFGHLAMDADDLRHFAERASLSTDDNPHVTFMAPRLTYQRDVKPHASLFALLDAAKPNVWATLRFSESAGDAEFARRVSNYIAARNIYLRGLVLDAEDRRDDAIAAYVESARLNSEFTSGYAQCVRIATVIAGSDPARAKIILERLIEVQPELPVAKDVLERLFPK